MASSLFRLRQIGSDCEKSGYVGLQLEARLAKSEIEMRSSRTSLAQIDLIQLEHDASARCFGLIARQAASARQVELAVPRLTPNRERANTFLLRDVTVQRFRVRAYQPHVCDGNVSLLSHAHMAINLVSKTLTFT